MADQTQRYIILYDLCIAPARIHGSPPVQLKVDDFQALHGAVKKAAEKKYPLHDAADVGGRQ